MSRTAFRPEIHGFHFANYFVNKILHVPPPFDKDIETYGRCGGMAFASLDYFYAKEPVPTHVSADFAPGLVPPDGHPLADYLYQRLLESYRPNLLTFVAWTQAPDEPAFLRGRGVPRMTREDQVPALVKALDAGDPVPLGLVFAGPSVLLTGIGNNHSVVAYGYDLDPDGTLRVYIYDNNQPDQEAVLTLDMHKPDARARFGEVPCRGFFVQAYQPAQPRYADLALEHSLVLSDRGAPGGAPLTVQCAVKNVGTSTAHLRELAVRVTGPDGQDLSASFNGDGNPTPLRPGESRQMASTTPALAAAAGACTFEAAYVSALGFRLGLPAAAPAAARRRLAAPHVTVRAMSTAVEPRRILLRRRIKVCVTALDSESRSPVPAARVWIMPAAGAAAQEVGPAGAELTYIFHRVRREGGGWVYPSGFVSAPGYTDAAIDFGFPAF